MNKRVVFLIILAVLVISLDYTMAQGCSQCKLISEQSTEAGEASFATNINKGILILMMMPYLILIIVFRKKIAGLFRKAKPTA